MMKRFAPIRPTILRSIVVAATALLLFLPVRLDAQAPKVVSFQGYLTDTGGTPSNTTVSMTFKLYKGATNIWTESQASVQVVNGIFHVLLGNVTPLDTVAFDQSMDLGIKVGADPEINPRTPLAAAAFSLGMPGMHTEYAEDSSLEGYNVIGGSAYNSASPGVVGATISGGGARTVASMSPFPNTVTDDWGTIGGGYRNTAGSFSTVSGGWNNVAVGASAVGGGERNTAAGAYSVVPGGEYNKALGDHSFAAGYNARPHHSGSFVWNDRSSFSLSDSLVTTANNQFLIRATGGVGIGTNNPGTHSVAIIDNGAGGIAGATLEVDNNSTSNAIAAHFETSGTDATVVIDQDGSGPLFRAFKAGDLHFQIDNAGNVTAEGSITGGGADIAEAVDVDGRRDAFEAGDVLVVSTAEDRSFAKCEESYSDLVAGVYATKPGVLMTNRGMKEDLSDRVPMGVVGIIPTKVTTENGPIRRGDLLVTSSTPGHAMRADRSRLEFGMVLGKALEPFDGPSSGLIEVLVSPR